MKEISLPRTPSPKNFSIGDKRPSLRSAPPSMPDKKKSIFPPHTQVLGGGGPGKGDLLQKVPSPGSPMPSPATTAVAVSGGRDSLLALALVAEAGPCMAVHGRFLPDPDPEGEAALAAQCAELGVPFHVIDLRDEFQARVVKPFIETYRAGDTPNPCAVCNAAVKFGLLLDAARDLDADTLAAGHYARLAELDDGTALLTGADETKDQSYFLSLVPRERLAMARFPLGEWRKADVLPALEARGLTPPKPSESQEVCFVPNDDYVSFLEAAADKLPAPGDITLADDGRTVGQHQGLHRYTIGQRRGLGVAWSEPLYVLGKDMAANALLVGPKAALTAHGCHVREVNLLSDPAAWPDKVLVKTRYRQRAVPAWVTLDGQNASIRFATPQEPPAPGQVACIYNAQGRVLAGGIIDLAATRAEPIAPKSDQR